MGREEKGRKRHEEQSTCVDGRRRRHSDGTGPGRVWRQFVELHCYELCGCELCKRQRKLGQRFVRERIVCKLG